MSKEIWKRHPKFNLLISDKGRFYNESKGYIHVHESCKHVNNLCYIYFDSNTINCAKAILETFREQKDEYYNKIYFKDGNRDNLNLDNLEWTLITGRDPKLIEGILEDIKNKKHVDDILEKYNYVYSVKTIYYLKNNYLKAHEKAIEFDESKEKWKQTEENKNILISNYGRLYNKKTNYIMKGRRNADNEKVTYYFIDNTSSGDYEHFSALRLVAKYFVDNPYNLHYIYNRNNVSSFYYKDLEYTLNSKFTLKVCMEMIKRFLINEEKPSVISKDFEIHYSTFKSILKEYNKRSIDVYEYFGIEKENEIWKDYDEILSVSNKGRFYNKERKAFIEKKFRDGFLTINYNKNNHGASKLVARTFLGIEKKPFDKIIYKDGNGKNINVENIEWSLFKNLSLKDCKEIKDLKDLGTSDAKIIRQYKTSPGTINKIMNYYKEGFLSDKK
ncbi:hypothetical protein [Staphylococcus phage vB_StaM_PB50]|nr:hypothetical protein [Staphylococcus phage vB_StaM_PB50]